MKGWRNIILQNLKNTAPGAASKAGIMKITKLGHCAMVLEHEGVKLLTDPGSFTVEQQNAVAGLHGILITHEHQDHLHIDSLKAVLANNPTAIIVGNSAVAKIVEEQIADTVVTVVGDGQSTDINGVSIEGFGKEHETIFREYGLVENTGYFVAGKFFFSGDAFYKPKKPVDVLALPVAGPWMKISQALEYALSVKPRIAFGVHDGMITPDGASQKWCEMVLPKEGIEFITLKSGETREF